MKYYSTNKQSPVVDFREAAIRGQAPDKGLYFPESIPSAGWLKSIDQLSREEIAFNAIHPYVGNQIPDEDLFTIVKETISFPIPVKQIAERISVLELFHGPTLAFKDIGARFMSRCLGYFLKDESKKVTVLVATSGDTGGAVASGFYDVPGVEVVILYPSGKVSPVQEKQLTTLGKNIHALEVAGNFDDCQQMVKQAFADQQLNESLFLTSANSINVARWLPQQFYYFFYWQQKKQKDQPAVVSVPSGNFGNICAGILAWQSGLPVSHFIAACNQNGIVDHYLDTYQLEIKKAKPTLSNAMDVGNPSNFVRVLEIFQHQFPALKDQLSSVNISDEETLDTIRRVYQQFSYTLDPHGAVGYLALERWLENHPRDTGLFIETAHPVKFPEAVEQATGSKLSIPAELNALMLKEKKSVLIRPAYNELREFLLAR